MSKVFLSHSSKDKEYVRYISEFFGKDKCVYDEMCFEAGMKNLDEIFRGLDSTSIFVLFISDSSLDSDWVKREILSAEDRLNQSQSALSQIFPIIIDSKIKHDDPRIPDFLKKGFGSYNLRFIKSNKIACKKIDTQITKRLFENSLVFQQKFNSFYGRDQEIKNFKDKFDCTSGIKCIISSGIDGIGRRSYLIEALRVSKIIPSYYEPSTISLSKNDTIEDLLMKLVELGFCDYTFEEVIALGNMDKKITALNQAFKEIQLQNEHIIIYDDLCLIDLGGEVRYWFNKALENLRSEVTVSIASRANISFTYQHNNPQYFSISLSSLPYPEWNGLLRVYSQSIGVLFTANDREFFKDVITGYPPQVINCADIAKEKGLQYVKDHSYELVKNITGKITKTLEIVFPDDLKEKGYGFLAFLSAYGTTPMTVIFEIIKLDNKYQELLLRLKSLTICRLIGASGDYIEVNPVVADYIQRSGFSIPNQIENYLKDKIEKFNQNLYSTPASDYEDYESIKYYLKENLKQGIPVPESLLYSTLYLNSVRELYDKPDYEKVIEIISQLKSSGAFDRFDDPVKEKLQAYYCRALARETKPEFYTEVELYKGINGIKINLIEYNFLRGFMYRQNGEFDKALDRYVKVLKERPDHRGAMREIVSVYRGLEDHESYRVYARLNYLRDLENPYQIQPYFESIIQLTNKSDEELKHIEDILTTMTSINSQKPLTAYYEILALYSIHIERNRDKAISVLKVGSSKFPESSYIAKALFDCYEFYDDLEGMKTSIELLRKTSHNRSSKIALEIREAIWDAHNKKPELTIISRVNSINGLTKDAKERVIIKARKILQR